jgi:hypothetical protein
MATLDEVVAVVGTEVTIELSVDVVFIDRASIRALLRTLPEWSGVAGF